MELPEAQPRVRKAPTGLGCTTAMRWALQEMLEPCTKPQDMPVHRPPTETPLLRLSRPAGISPISCWWWLCAGVEANRHRGDGARSRARRAQLVSRRMGKACETIAAGFGDARGCSRLLPGLCRHRVRSPLVLDLSELFQEGHFQSPLFF